MSRPLEFLCYYVDVGLVRELYNDDGCDCERQRCVVVSVLLMVVTGSSVVMVVVIDMVAEVRGCVCDRCGFRNVAVGCD